MILRILACSIAWVALASAAPAHAKKPPKGFEPAAPAPSIAPRADGSIFAVNAGYTPLVTGSYAHNVGDVLTIALNETVQTTKTAGTKTQRTGSASLTPPTAGPLAINPNALNASGTSSFNGSGNTTQTSNFTGTIAVTIAEVRPNGTAMVKGEKRMLLSQGEEWVQFSGIVRLADIDQTNTVQSGQVANAHIEYAGNGAITRSAREGWLLKFFNQISPF